VSVREISSLPLKRSAMKGFNIYFVQIFNNIGERDDNLLTNDPLLKEFQDVFVEEIPALLPN
jgi:hypothetical protein